MRSNLCLKLVRHPLWSDPCKRLLSCRHYHGKVLPRTQLGSNPIRNHVFASKKDSRFTWLSMVSRSMATKKQSRAADHSGNPLEIKDPKPQMADTLTNTSSLILPFNSKLTTPKAQWSSHDQFKGVDSNNSLATFSGLHSAINADTLESAQYTFDPLLHMASAPTNWRGYEPATPLWKALQALIAVTGRPISVADYMRLALTHPQYGYYTNKDKKINVSTGKSNSSTTVIDDFDVDDYDIESSSSNNNQSDTNPWIGSMGDFVTAPEMSQVFGESLAVWFITQWEQQMQSSTLSTKDSSYQWLECGPGRGTLIHDMIKFANKHPTFGKKCQFVHLVEASASMRQQQKELLSNSLKDIKITFFNGENNDEKAEDSVIKVVWHNTVTDFMLWQEKQQTFLPTFAVCQEFIDALPVYVFEKTKEGWRERLVDVAVRRDLLDSEDLDKQPVLDENSNIPRLRLVLAPEVTPAAKILLQIDEKGNLPNESEQNAPIGSVIEVNPEGMLLVQDLAKILEKQGGAALIFDYGEEGTADSIRSYAAHQQVSFLTRPGQVDVTADVDFAALKYAVARLNLSKVQTFGPQTQGEFLMAMGIKERMLHAIEQDETTEEQAEDLYETLVRLCSPDEMGQRFKVLALSQKKDGIFNPPGF